MIESFEGDDNTYQINEWLDFNLNENLRLDILF